MFEVQAILALSIVVLCFLGMMFTRYAPDVLLMGGVTVLLVAGVLSPTQALSGFSNEGTITVALLFVVARGLAATGTAEMIASAFLGRPKSLGLAQLRLMLPVAALSSVVNNTPIVAMMIPAVMDWVKRTRFPLSQLLMPLSYAAIMGGACTLIGTSTNLVVDDLLREFYQQQGDSGHGLGIFELAWVGLPCVLVVMVYVLVASPRLLPHRGSASMLRYSDTRQYTVEMLVDHDSPLVGKTIEDAGLRNLPGLFLVEIQRSGHLITAVGPAQQLHAEDRLVFAGAVESVVDLQKIRGLRPADDQIFKLDSARSQRHLVEVVISNRFPQLGKTVKQGRFRSTYGAAIIAVAREGQRLKGRIGDIALKPGDTLLIEAGRSFERQQRYVRDFLMVRRIDDYSPVSHERMPIALSIFAVMILLAATSILSMLEAVLLAAGAMIITRCIRAEDARRSIDWQVLVVIAASIALGAALESSGAAAVIAVSVVSLVSGSGFGLICALFFITALFSALISNVAAAVLVFPIASAAAQQMGLDLTPVAVTLMIAASASFSTPIGYQTNLMVYSPGKYRFVDFLKMGLPLTLLVGLTTVLLVPIVWPL